MDFEKLITNLTRLEYDLIETELSTFKKKQLKELYEFIYPESEFTQMDKEDYIEDLTAFIYSQKEYRVEDNVDGFDARTEFVHDHMNIAGYVTDPIEQSAFITTALFFKNGYDYHPTDVTRLHDYGIEIDYESEDDNDDYFRQQLLNEHSNVFNKEPNEIVFLGKKKKKSKPSFKKLNKQKIREDQLALDTNYREIMKANNLQNWINVDIRNTNIFEIIQSEDFERAKADHNQKLNLHNIDPIQNNMLSSFDIQLSTDNKIDHFRNIIYDIGENPIDQNYHDYYLKVFENHCNQIYWRSKHYDEETKTTWKVIFQPSGSGKTKLKAKHKDKYFDISDLLYQRLDYILIHRKIWLYSIIHDDFRLLNLFWNYLVYLNRFRIKGKILLCNSIYQINYTLTKRHQLGIIPFKPGRKTDSLFQQKEILSSNFYIKTKHQLYDDVISNYFNSFNYLKEDHNSFKLVRNSNVKILK